MTRSDLIRRGQRNIEDALFIRERAIPVAIEGKRWNIVVFESYRVLELLLKGMICLSGHTPKSTHRIVSLVDRFCRILTSWRGNVPFIYSALNSAGNGYAIIVRDTSVALLKRIRGIYTQLGTWSIKEVSPENFLQLALFVDGGKVGISLAGKPVLMTTDSSVGTKIRLQRGFVKQPDSERLERLKQAGMQLLEKREAAFYSEREYSEADATAAVDLMDIARGAVNAFLIIDAGWGSSAKSVKS